MLEQSPPLITSFLVKIASRCNLACDYCYMYEHADQSWRSQPTIMSKKTVGLLAQRIAEYVEKTGMEKLLLVFHGGEPLLAGSERIVDATIEIRDRVRPGTTVDAAVQTNGTLLKDSDLRLFQIHGIGVSISIDGPAVANDLHRLDHKSKSSFPATFNAIRLLRGFPKVYSGLICVIDPSVPPQRLLDFFCELEPPNLDFLLPDATHVTPPPGRDTHPTLYKDWLLTLFDLWFDHYPHMRIRTFDNLLEAIAGLPGTTDSFGLGDVSLLTIETDGTYHDLDILKITKHGATSLGMDLEQNSIFDVASSEALDVHRELLSLVGLSLECRRCPVVSICGGGCVPHRYSETGFGNPTVYCSEMLALIQHAKQRVKDTLTITPSPKSAELVLDCDEVSCFDDHVFNKDLLHRLYYAESTHQRQRLRSVIAALGAKGNTEARALVDELAEAHEHRQLEVSVQPSIVFWISLSEQYFTGGIPKTIDGDPICKQDEYVSTIREWVKNGIPSGIRINRQDEMLRLPFGHTIVFEQGEFARKCEVIVREAFDLIGDWNPDLIKEMRWLSPEIQLIHDTTAHPNKAVSFSDNAVPHCLYISLRQDGGLLNAYDVADSLIHEHRHQRLYLLQASVPLITVDAPFVHSPWRAEPRPPSGLLHAVYVFCGLLQWWIHISHSTEGEVQSNARHEVGIIVSKLNEAFPTLQKTSLTAAGTSLVSALRQSYEKVT